MENLGTGLYNKVLGIIGMGRIGQAVAKRAVVSGMKILYYNRHRLPEEIEKRYSAEYVSMDTLLSQSDYISLHTPLDDSTYHLIDAEAMSKMKNGVFIVNTARGPVVEEAALVASLEKVCLMFMYWVRIINQEMRINQKIVQLIIIIALFLQIILAPLLVINIVILMLVIYLLPILI